MAMTQVETFAWMVAELARLREENERLQNQVVTQSLELARLRTAPLAAKERKGENIGDLRTMLLRDTATPGEPNP